VLFAVVLFVLIGAAFSVVVFLSGTLLEGGRSFASQEKIGVVLVEGIIRDAREIVKQLTDYAKDDAIRAVVVRIDSPGGGVAPSDEIYGAIRELRKKKRVVASMGSLAASGGYLIACGANRIVASPGTLTGSLSAVMHFANVEALMKKIGVSAEVIKSGKFKDIGSPARAMTAEERLVLQEVVDDIYDYLLEVVSRERKIDKESLRPLADGRLFTGRQALKLKLVDELGNLDQALDLAGRLAGIEGKPEAVYPPKKKSSLWEFLLQGATSVLVAEWHKGQVSSMPGLYYLHEGGILP
jgi:protease-4